MTTSRITFTTAALTTGRRALFSSAGQATLSASAVALLVGCESMAGGERMSAQAGGSDAGILNVALGLEHEAINAYQIGAESGLLQPAVMQVAVTFQSHHKEHRDALIATIRKLGATPVGEKTRAEYVRDLNAAAIRNQTDILRLAQRLERGAANAYIGVIPSFGDRAYAQVAARLIADETMHWTALSSALGDALPQKAFSFGA